MILKKNLMFLAITMLSRHDVQTLALLEINLVIAVYPKRLVH